MKFLKYLIKKIEFKEVVNMIKPEMLKKGDKIAVVSLSSGKLSDDKFIHKYYIAKKDIKEYQMIIHQKNIENLLMFQSLERQH